MPGFTLFAFLWCAAILFHQLFQGRFAVLDGTSLLTFAALFGLLRPSSLPRFTLVLAIHLATVVAEMPRVVNHWLLMGATSLGLLAFLVPKLRRPDARSERALRGALVSVQAQIVIVYVLATLAKVNAGFFDPADSCGAEHYRRLAGAVPIFPLAPWAITTAILGTLVAELTLPILLVVRRTRLLAFFAGWMFHLMLGWNGYWDFSLVAVAYYSAFAPPGLIAGGQRAAEELPWLRTLRDRWRTVSASPFAFPVAAAVLLVPAGLAALSDTPSREIILAWNRAGKIVWLFAWAGIGLALLLAVRASAGRPEEPAPEPVRGWWRQPALALGPALVLLNGFSPYLGLKTEHSYTMFSNIRTEGDEWNHYVVPSAVRVFSFQDEPVRLVLSSDPYLQRLAKRGYRLVPFDLQHYAGEHPDAGLVYETSEGRFAARRMDSDPRLSEPVNPVWAKLFLFRPVPPAERNACLH